MAVPTAPIRREVAMLDLVWVRLLYVVFTAGVVVLHMEYVHRRHVEYSRGFITFQPYG